MLLADGFDPSDLVLYVPYTGAAGALVYLIIKSVKFIDARTNNALNDLRAENARLRDEAQQLRERAYHAEDDADKERLARIDAERRAGISEAQAAALTQKVMDLTAEVHHLRDEVKRLRVEMHGGT